MSSVLPGKRTGGLWLLLLVGLIFGVALAWLWLDGWRTLNRPLTDRPHSLLTLASGETLQNVLQTLKNREQLVTNRLMRLTVSLLGTANHLQAGEYLVTDRSLVALLDAMHKGLVYQRLFTLISGWNWHQLKQALAQTPDLGQELILLDAAQAKKRLGISLTSIEGAFYPDTYAYSKGMSDAAVLHLAYRKMRAVLATAWASRMPNLPLANQQEALILASIVEKETGLDSERAMIASVLINRLRANMNLEVDPTVIFGLGAEFNGNLTRRHLRQPTPYNTYIHKGLPPTPVAFPSKASITAALSPVVSKALFFVARGDGSSEFSETLRQHNAAIKKYQLKQKSEH